MSDFVTRKEWNDLWEELSLVKALVQEWPHGPCAKQVEGVAKHFLGKLEILDKSVADQLTGMVEMIKQVQQDSFTTRNRALEVQKQSSASVNRTNDYLKEYEARIAMVQKAHTDLLTQWNAVLKTIGFTLDFVPAKYEITKVEG